MFRSVRSLLTVAVIVAGLSSFVVGCGSATSPSPTVSTITVAGSVQAVGTTAQFTATAAMSDGTTQDVTSQATWQSSNTDDATVSSAGAVTAVADGAATITATYKSVSGSEAIVISD